MPRPKHRAPLRRRPTLPRATGATLGALALAGTAALGPSAYADTQSHFHHHAIKHHPAHSKPAKPAHKPADDNANDATGANDAPVTNGGKSLPGDAGQTLDDLKPTAEPATPYEM